MKITPKWSYKRKSLDFSRVTGLTNQQCSIRQQKLPCLNGRTTFYTQNYSIKRIKLINGVFFFFLLMCVWDKVTQ